MVSKGLFRQDIVSQGHQIKVFFQEHLHVLFYLLAECITKTCSLWTKVRLHGGHSMINNARRFLQLFYMQHHIILHSPTLHFVHQHYTLCITSLYNLYCQKHKQWGSILSQKTVSSGDMQTLRPKLGEQIKNRLIGMSREMPKQRSKNKIYKF